MPPRLSQFYAHTGGDVFDRFVKRRKPGLFRGFAFEHGLLGGLLRGMDDGSGRGVLRRNIGNKL